VLASESHPVVKSEDVVTEDVQELLKEEVTYRVYSSAADISYNPEMALQEGLIMVEEISKKIKTLELGSKLRKDLWVREVER